MVDIVGKLSSELKISISQVKQCNRIIDAGNTVPLFLDIERTNRGLSDEVLREFLKANIP